MNTKKIFKVLESGQVIPLVVVMFFAIIAMVALILDGGSILSNRRTAQAAADSGALAGARELCKKSPTQTVIDAANNYANKNNASSAQANVVTIQINGKDTSQVKVDTTVTNPSFFAKLFGVKNLAANAEAAAGCFYPSQGNYIMPIAWSCRPPITGSNSTDCEIKTLDWASQIKPLQTGSPTFVTVDGQTVNYQANFFLNRPSSNTDVMGHYLYVVMDSDKVCGVDINCDLNGDGRNEIESGGNRGWLNLSQDSSGVPNLTDWIYPPGVNKPITIHTWLSGVNGNKTPVYTALKTRIGDVVLVPVFNELCANVPDETNPADPCIQKAHATFPLTPGETELVLPGSPAKPMFHIVGFAPFYITCVYSKSSDKCPGFDLAASLNPSLKNNTNTVEGYFVSGYPFQLENPGTGGVDVGIHIISLTK